MPSQPILASERRLDLDYHQFPVTVPPSDLTTPSFKHSSVDFHKLDDHQVVPEKYFKSWAGSQSNQLERTSEIKGPQSESLVGNSKRSYVSIASRPRSIHFDALGKQF